MLDERRVGRGLKGNICDHIEILSWHFLRGLRNTMGTRIRVGYTSECAPPKFKFGVITLHQSTGFEFCCTDTMLCVDCCPES